MAVALVCWVRTPAAVISKICGAWRGIAVYGVTMDGEIRRHQGPQIARVNDIRARTIIWVGVPGGWAQNNGPKDDPGAAKDPNLAIRHHYIGHASRFTVEDALPLIRHAINAAIEESKGAREEQAKREAERRANTRAALRRMRHTGEPPLYVPTVMR